MLSDSQILAYNPWWTDSQWVHADAHLAALAAQPIRLPAELPAAINFIESGIHVIRGPRQVGKSTDLKLIAQRALTKGRPPRSVAYLALDLLEGSPVSELAETILRTKQLSGFDGASVLLLDEVTSAERWQTAIKTLWDDGTLRGDVVICTGSSASELHDGAAERLPGRRGAGTDHMVLPQSFGAFAGAIDRSIPKSPELTVAELMQPSGRKILNEALAYGPKFDRALEKFLSFGGLPAAVAEAGGGAINPSASLLNVVADSLAKELQRRGASAPAADALLSRVARALGSDTNWTDLAREMDVPLGRRSGTSPSHHTLRTYLEAMASAYFLFIVYGWRSNAPTNDLSRNKKIYFADPLIHSLAVSRTPGTPYDVAAAVENAVGMALLRRYESTRRLPEAFTAPSRLHVWRSANGNEIDFVAGPRDSLDVVEVKYQRNPRANVGRTIERTLPGRPAIIATKDTFELNERFAMLPSAMLLWALG